MSDYDKYLKFIPPRYIKTTGRIFKRKTVDEAKFKNDATSMFTYGEYCFNSFYKYHGFYVRLSYIGQAALELDKILSANAESYYVSSEVAQYIPIILEGETK